MLTCNLSLVGVTDAVTLAQSPAAAIGLGAKAQGVLSLVVPGPVTVPDAPRVIDSTAAVIVPPLLLLLKLGSCAINLQAARLSSG